jgi:hypothetical protein
MNSLIKKITLIKLRAKKRKEFVASWNLAVAKNWQRLTKNPPNLKTLTHVERNSERLCNLVTKKIKK